MLKKGFAIFVLMIMLLSAACAENISPTTGLPLEGEPTAPMLAVISHTEGSTEINGKTVKAAGVGKRQPWGGQQSCVLISSPWGQPVVPVPSKMDSRLCVYQNIFTANTEETHIF